MRLDDNGNVVNDDKTNAETESPAWASNRSTVEFLKQNKAAHTPRKKEDVLKHSKVPRHFKEYGVTIKKNVWDEYRAKMLEC